MPQQWTDASQRLLLLAINHVSNPPPPNWDDVAALMGQGFSGNAVRLQFGKLRKEAKEQFGDGANPSTSKKGTPAPAAGKKRKADKQAESTEENEDEDKDEVKGGAKKMKVEDQEESV